MAKGIVVTYECTQCGSEIIVTEAVGSQLRPIYCCGMEVAEVSSGPAKAARSKRGKEAKKPVKKTVKAAKKATTKKTVAKKKAAPKKKTSRK